MSVCDRASDLTCSTHMSFWTLTEKRCENADAEDKFLRPIKPADPARAILEDDATIQHESVITDG